MRGLGGWGGVGNWGNEANFGGGRRGGGGGFEASGLEALEALEGAVVGAAEGGDATLEDDEMVGDAVVGEGEGAGLVELGAEVVAAAAELGVPDLGFDGVHAAEEPVGAEEFEDEGGFARAFGAAGVEVFGGEGVEGGGVLILKEEGFGVEAGAEGVAGGGGATGVGTGSGGEERITAIRFDLGLGGHLGSGVARRQWASGTVRL